MSTANRSLKPYPPANLGINDTSAPPTGGTTYLADDFNDGIIAAEWNGTGCTESSGVLNIPVSQRLMSASNTLSFTDCYLKCKVASGASADLFIMVNDGTRIIEIRYQPVALSKLRLTQFVGSDTHVDYVYSSIADVLYVKLTHSTASNNFVLSTSPDDVTYTPRATQTVGVGWNLNAVYVDIANVGTPTAQIDNFNSTIVIGTGSPATGRAEATWKNRNRLTSGIKKQTAAGDALEASQTHTLKIYGQDGTTLLRTVTGLTAELYDYLATQEIIDTGGGTVLQTSLTFKIQSTRGGYLSAEVVKTLVR